MKIISINNYPKATFTSKEKLPLKVIDKALELRLNNIDAFFNNPEKLAIVEENKRYSAKVSKYIANNIGVKPDVSKTPFNI